MPAKPIKSNDQIRAEIAEAVRIAEAIRAHHPARPPGSRDVTEAVLQESGSGPGEHSRRVNAARPARDLTSTTSAALVSWLRQHDKTVGYVSRLLAYSRAMPTRKSAHADLIRVIRGGHLRVYLVPSSPPAGSNAHRDSPYADRYYVIE